MKILAWALVFFLFFGVVGAAVSTVLAWAYNVALAEPFGWPHLLWWQVWLIWIIVGALRGPTRSAKEDKR